MTAKYPSRFRISAILAATYAICAVGSVHGSTSVEETWAQTSASQSAESQAAMTPAMALQFLKEGNERFRNRVRMNRQFIDQVKATGSGQYPFAAVLSCIDSRAPAELVFDQGIGDIFNIRVAGNTVNNDILGSLEYSCKAAGSKLVLVMGHTHCGMIKATCQDVELGHVTQMVEKQEAVFDAMGDEERDCKDDEYMRRVTQKNVEASIKQIRENSEILRSMEEKGEIAIKGAIYDVENGLVTFM